MSSRTLNTEFIRDTMFLLWTFIMHQINSVKQHILYYRLQQTTGICTTLCCKMTIKRLRLNNKYQTE